MMVNDEMMKYLLVLGINVSKDDRELSCLNIFDVSNTQNENLKTVNIKPNQIRAKNEEVIIEQCSQRKCKV